MKPADLSSLVDVSPDIISTEEQIEKFIESTLHTDYLAEIDCRMAFYKDCLVDQNLDYSGRDYDVMRGFITDLTHMRGLFTDMLMNKKGA